MWEIRQTYEVGKFIRERNENKELENGRDPWSKCDRNGKILAVSPQNLAVEVSRTIMNPVSVKKRVLSS